MSLNSYIFIEINHNRTPLNQCAFNLDKSKVSTIKKDQLSDNASVSGGICTYSVNGMKYFLFLNPLSGPLNGYLLPIMRYGSETDIPTTLENIEWATTTTNMVYAGVEGIIVSEPINGYPISTGSLAQRFKPLYQDQTGTWCGATCDLKNGALVNTYLAPIIGILDTDLINSNIIQAVYPTIYSSHYQTQQAVSLVTSIFNFIMSIFGRKRN